MASLLRLDATRGETLSPKHLPDGSKEQCCRDAQSLWLYQIKCISRGMDLCASHAQSNSGEPLLEERSLIGGDIAYHQGDIEPASSLVKRLYENFSPRS